MIVGFPHIQNYHVLIFIHPTTKLVLRYFLDTAFRVFNKILPGFSLLRGGHNKLLCSPEMLQFYRNPVLFQLSIRLTGKRLATAALAGNDPEPLAGTERR
jgi:hypothetical protein